MENKMTKEECREKLKEALLKEMINKRNPEEYEKAVTERKKIEQEFRQIKFAEKQKIDNGGRKK